MKKAWLLLPLAIPPILIGCADGDKLPPNSGGLVATRKVWRPTSRPRDPWVFRSVLDGHARMLTIALADDCWVTYDTQTCALVKAWKGNVFFTGGVYDTKHGPQPRSVGPAYFSATQPSPIDTTPKLVKKDGTVVQPKYLGYQVVDNAVVLRYAFGDAVVTESPEWQPNGSLVRTFRGEGLPAGSDVELTVMGLASTSARDGHAHATPNGATTAVRMDWNFDVDVTVALETSGQ